MSLICDRQARLRLRRPRLHDRQRRTSATRSRTWSTTPCASSGMRHTRDPDRHDRLPAAAARAGPPSRRAALHDHLLRALAADGEHRRARLPDLGQRHGGRRAVQRLLRPPPRLPARGPRRRRRCTTRSLGELAASTSQPIVRNPFLQDPELLRRRPGAGASTSTSTPTSSPATCACRSTSGSRRRRYTDDLLRNRMLNELFHEAVPVILHEDDLNAMYFSIENRSPFLDRDAVRVLVLDPDPPPRARRHGEGGAARRDARDRAPTGSSTTAARSASTRRSSSFLDVERPEVREELLGRQPDLRARAPRPDRGAARLEWLPNSKSKFLFNFVCAKLFLEEFGGVDGERSSRPRPRRVMEFSRSIRRASSAWATAAGHQARGRPVAGRRRAGDLADRLRHRARRDAQVVGLLRDAVAERAAGGARPAGGARDRRAARRRGAASACTCCSWSAGREDDFQEYAEAEGMRVVAWLDDDEASRRRRGDSEPERTVDHAKDREPVERDT